MDVPAAVATAVDDERVAASVPLNGDDALFVTPTRLVLYRADGLLSNESVAVFDHDAERVTVSEGRRKATITLDYGLDGEDSFSVPSGRLDDVLHPVLAVALNAAGVTDPGESVRRTFRFSELTLVVTSARVVRHVGAAVWDTDYDEIPYADVTDVGTEEGSVASQLVLETNARSQRIKIPNESFRDVRETVERSLYESYGVESYAAFRREVGEAEDDEAAPSAVDDFADSGIDPIQPDIPADPDDAAVDEAEPATEPSPAADAASEQGAGAASEHAAEQRASAATATTRERDRPDPAADADREPDVDLDALADDLSAVRDALDEQCERATEQRERIERQREAIARQRDAIETQLDTLDEQRETVDAQLDALDAERERLDDALDAIRDR